MTTPAIQKGDTVYLAEGPYQGTAGIFDAVAEDPAWGSITESGGRVRRHPMIWLRQGTFPIGASPLAHTS